MGVCRTQVQGLEEGFSLGNLLIAKSEATGTDTVISASPWSSSSFHGVPFTLLWSPLPDGFPGELGALAC